MASDEEKEDDVNKSYDEVSELLKRFYKPTKDTNAKEFWESVSKKIDSLFHKELLSDKTTGEIGNVLSDEARYYLGLEEYIRNEVSSLKHKLITDHLLVCKECRQNYINLLDKKKITDRELVSVT